MPSFSIRTFEFNDSLQDVSNPSKTLYDDPMGTNWPVVYLIYGKTSREIYIGESNSATGRMEQHREPNKHFSDDRSKLDKVEIIFDPTFNKSAILDIENSLIGLFRYEVEESKEHKSAYFDRLQNGNAGQSKLHNYYNRAHYQDEVEDIWKELKTKGLATNDYQEIVNDVLFKFSPYTTLNEEQREVSIKILNGIMDALEKIKAGVKADYTAVIKGGAGTGKTIVLVNLFARFIQAAKSNQTDFRLEESEVDEVFELKELSPEAKLINRIKNYTTQYGIPRIAYVAQMSSLRKTMATVLHQIPGVKKKDAKGPFDIVNESHVTDTEGKDEFRPFDIVLVDEAHRLWRNKKLGQSTTKYKNACEKVYAPGTDPDSVTALDMIFDSSLTRVLVYDAVQTVKDSDITYDQYITTLGRRNPSDVHEFTLRQQMRCRAGLDYICYLDDIFNNDPGITRKSIANYDLQYFDDPNKLIDAIILKNKTFNLCKCVTGYGWQWVAKRYDECGEKYKEWLNSSGLEDTRSRRHDFFLRNLRIEDGLIEFDGKRYVRNLDFDWILKGDPREIGCIHTSQGYDLNYVGVLFGPEIDYKPGEGIVVYESKIKDSSVGHSLQGLSGAALASKKKEIRNYVVNAYKVMMERGIRGCFVYAHNPGMKAYLSKFF